MEKDIALYLSLIERVKMLPRYQKINDEHQKVRSAIAGSIHDYYFAAANSILMKTFYTEFVKQLNKLNKKPNKQKYLKQLKSYMVTFTIDGDKFLKFFKRPLLNLDGKKAVYDYSGCDFAFNIMKDDILKILKNKQIWKHATEIVYVREGRVEDGLRPHWHAGILTYGYIKKEHFKTYIKYYGSVDIEISYNKNPNKQSFLDYFINDKPKKHNKCSQNILNNTHARI